jgi:hypothetical protein
MSTNLPPTSIRCAAVLVVLLMGCVRAQVTPFDPTPVMDHRTPVDRIRFYDTQRPTCAYKELGHVTATGDWLFSTWAGVVKKVRTKAHDLGGDAVLSLRERTRIDGAVISRNEISTTESHSLSGTVIRFVDPSCRE